jgi:hypothetical protein
MIQILYKDGSMTDIPSYLSAGWGDAGRWFVVNFTNGETVYYNADNLLKVRFSAPVSPPSPK